MKNTRSALAATALIGMLAVAGCSSDDKEKAKDAATTASKAASSASSAATSANADDQLASASKSLESMQSRAGGDCKISVDGKEATTSVIGMSCDDAKGVWNAFGGKSDQAANESVEYKGEKYQCSTGEFNGKRASSCTSSSGKAFAVAN
ncbi:hypothetical protein H7F30_00085 [Dermacoccus sp. PAMC28757]|uniref:hypothetical protein n=1 Tax=Dermacoccus sp. PAMC28757 TaxID=2762331 RepID=UPI00164E81E8|nr:hypothetical protein [Dermacoccus sp. PAMC28757]QNK52798.1 hypothetical protein H7F30_00085 [Dermacoccus sp. PAMC28757]